MVLSLVGIRVERRRCCHGNNLPSISGNDRILKQQDQMVTANHQSKRGRISIMDNRARAAIGVLQWIGRNLWQWPTDHEVLGARYQHSLPGCYFTCQES